MALIDWVVVLAYFVAMLGIGWYYSRQSQTAEEFALAGRSMHPIAAGLSLFATLASTLSYLAIPGEVIGHGPMVLSLIAAYPIILAVVGWGLIPYLMKQPVTSAYEILEAKLGSNIRLAGAGIFLLLRLGWMSAILFATSHVVLVPLLKMDDGMTPWLCGGLGLITMIYSSAGGIKAVVVTDALQAIMMLMGAVATIIVISVQMGGISACIPTAWPSHWDPPVWGFDPSARLAFLPYMLSTVIWYVCTNGSDQMSIQRFLSTRDAPAARRTLVVSLGSDTIVTLLLAAAGVALLSYYQRFPELLAPGVSPSSNADRVFPDYIGQGMPFGLSGLVIAAILAAAMSSLASGMNSTSVVIERDFVSRLIPPSSASDPDGLTESQSSDQSVSRMRLLTLFIGVLAILLSIGNMYIEGNLLERCNKVTNLLTAPLFVLFFLALFVPWSNSTGAWCSLVASISTAVGVAYYELFGISQFWMTPAALLVGIIVGVSVSGIVYPFRRRPLLESGM